MEERSDPKARALRMLRNHAAGIARMERAIEDARAALLTGVDHAAALGATIPEMAEASGLTEAAIRERTGNRDHGR